MAHDILHIKDSYYFDVPKSLWQVHYSTPAEYRARVGDWFVRNDDDYQDWEADLIIARLRDEIGVDNSHLEHLKDHWHAWQHADHVREARPLDRYIDGRIAEMDAVAATWAKTAAPSARHPLKAYIAAHPNTRDAWMVNLVTDPEKATKWRAIERDMDAPKILDDYIASDRGHWASEKVAAYNNYLAGKIFIPQPKGAMLRNAYERESGFAISKFMIIEVTVAILLFIAFTWLARRLTAGGPPRGKRVNFLESFLTFIRNEVVLPGMGEHDTDRFLPFFWTVFMFILGCNLMGMLPWIGAPSAALGMTGALALIVFALGLFLGIRQFGILGYLKNLMPSLGLPLYLAVVIVPMVWVIEFASLFIRHGILAIRLLANMVAGHMVLLGILGLAVGVEAAHMGMLQWSIVAVISVLATTALSFMELFVAFLQAYVFTLLAAMFIGSSIHHH
ncbi:MAG: F0F1 ATP synthase subunit A [Aureliella sp.]